MATKTNSLERRAKIYKLQEHERHLVRSCEQIILLNDKIRGLTKRYESAKAEGFRSFRYNLRVRLAVVEGVRNVFYEYARDMAEDIADLRRELYGQNVEIITDTDGENSDFDRSLVNDDDDDYSDNYSDFDWDDENDDEDDDDYDFEVDDDDCDDSGSVAELAGNVDGMEV